MFLLKCLLPVLANLSCLLSGGRNLSFHEFLYPLNLPSWDRSCHEILLVSQHAQSASLVLLVSILRLSIRSVWVDRFPLCGIVLLSQSERVDIESDLSHPHQVNLVGHDSDHEVSPILLLNEVNFKVLEEEMDSSCKEVDQGLHLDKCLVASRDIHVAHDCHISVLYKVVAEAVFTLANIKETFLVRDYKASKGVSLPCLEDRLHFASEDAFGSHVFLDNTWLLG
jgi:hypothetical protein